ncbi:hypothetical protein [Thermocrinis sp.]|uniref:hypothetical protein n=1 Tax=Thermocrinis sp. TaxID=2024383 RepID=UPI002FDE7672
MILHPMFSYPALLLALVVFSMYILGTLSGKESLKRYAVYGNLVLFFILLLAVFFGFRVSEVPLVASKLPFLWAFPHKWNGIFLTVFSLITLAYFKLKGEGSKKVGLILCFIGLFMVLFQLITGWMLRLVFFS